MTSAQGTVPGGLEPRRLRKELNSCAGQGLVRKQRMPRASRGCLQRRDPRPHPRRRRLIDELPISGLGYLGYTRRMIHGAHIIIYSTDSEADRGFFRDVLKFESVDAGHGWLIFAL